MILFGNEMFHTSATFSKVKCPNHNFKNLYFQKFKICCFLPVLLGQNMLCILPLLDVFEIS